MIEAVCYNVQLQGGLELGRRYLEATLQRGDALQSVADSTPDDSARTRVLSQHLVTRRTTATVRGPWQRMAPITNTWA